jgi:hypothetical protein
MTAALMLRITCAGVFGIAFVWVAIVVGRSKRRIRRAEDAG